MKNEPSPKKKDPAPSPQNPAEKSDTSAKDKYSLEDVILQLMYNNDTLKEVASNTASLSSTKLKRERGAEEPAKMSDEARAASAYIAQCCEGIYNTLADLKDESVLATGFLKKSYLELQKATSTLNVIGLTMTKDLDKLGKIFASKIGAISRAEQAKGKVRQTLDPQKILDEMGLTGALFSFGADVLLATKDFTKGMFETAKKFGKNIFDSLKKIDLSSITNRLSKASSGLAKSFGKAVDWLKDSELVKQMKDFGAHIKDSFVEFYDSLKNSELVKQLKNFGTKIKDSFVQFYDKIKNSQVFKKIGGAVDSLMTGIGLIGSKISGLAKRIADSALFKSIKSAFAGIGGALMNAFSGIKKTVGKVTDRLAPGAKKVLSKAKEKLGELAPEALQKGFAAFGAAKAKFLGKKIKKKKIKVEKEDKEEKKPGFFKTLTEKTGKGIKGFLQFLADGIAKFGDSKVVNGAKSLLFIGGTLLATAFALKTMNDVEWSSLVKGMLALGLLATTAVLIGKVSKDILKTSISMAVMAGALWIAAKAIQEYKNVDLKDALKAGAVLAVLAGAAVIVGKFATDAIKGALAIGIIAGSLYVAAKSIAEFANVEQDAMVRAGAALLGMTLTVVAIGQFATEALKGAAALLILGGALWLSAKGFQEMAKVNWDNVGQGVLAILLFGTAAAALGALIEVIGPGVLALAGLGIALMLAGKGIDMFSKSTDAFITLQWDKIMKGTLALAAMGLVLGAVSIPLLAAGAALIVFGAGAVAANLGMGAFATNLEKLNGVSASNMLGLAGSLTALGVAMAAFGVGNVVSGVANLVTNLLSIGQDSPVEQLIKIGKAGDGIKNAADGMERLASAMERFANISPDAMKSLRQFPWDKISSAGALVPDTRIVSPQENVATANITGATMNVMQSQTGDLNKSAAMIPMVIPAAPAPAAPSLSSTSVSNVTYNSNNMPDRTTNYLTPAYGF